jgi:hypothetical protein
LFLLITCLHFSNIVLYGETSTAQFYLFLAVSLITLPLESSFTFRFDLG